ncbi:hypothetical protein P1P91_14435 [Halomonas piscis]|uniref:ABC transporter permease n=1 Tax=Halomonas piscis TaxID=3031727 RepID=A0ABY9Z145_9GAMM|nr:hypothetical protein [Halomonas piscis]WNK19999.1 hypothetical protein P1P91_14435 [Halomonas piscis]
MSSRHSATADASTTPRTYPDAVLAQRGFFRHMHKGMTITSALLVLAFALFTGIDPAFSGSVFGTARE